LEKLIVPLICILGAYGGHFNSIKVTYHWHLLIGSHGYTSGAHHILGWLYHPKCIQTSGCACGDIVTVGAKVKRWPPPGVEDILIRESTCKGTKEWCNPKNLEDHKL